MLLAAALLATPARAASPFIEQLRKTQARSADDPERIEFATRAIRAWVPEDGRTLLAAAYYARAEGEIARLDDALAAEDLEKALGDDPGNVRAQGLLARALVGIGRGAEAEQAALAYLEERGEDAEAWLALGEARLLQGKSKADKPAREAFQKAAALLGHEDPRPSLGEGKAHLSANRRKDALAALTAAADNPGKWRAEILAERSRVYAALGDYKAALSDLVKALPDLERRFDERRGRAPRALEKARGALADAYFRAGVAREALSLKDTALLDHRSACDLGHAGACARVKALSRPEPKPEKKPEPPKKKKKKNPKGGTGERIYAN